MLGQNPNVHGLAKRTTGWTDTYACPPHTSDGGMPQDEAGVSNTPMLSGHPHYVNEKKFRKTVQECRNTCQKNQRSLHGSSEAARPYPHTLLPRREHQNPTSGGTGLPKRR